MTRLVPDAGRLAEHAEEIKARFSGLDDPKTRFKWQIRRIICGLSEVILEADYDQLGAIEDAAFANRCLDDAIRQARSFEDKR